MFSGKVEKEKNAFTTKKLENNEKEKREQKKKLFL